MLRSYIPHGSTDELLSSLGNIDPTATLKKLTPHERAIEECKRINWWRECEKQKPAGVEDLSSDEEGDDEADEDPAQVCVYAQMDTKRPKRHIGRFTLPARRYNNVNMPKSTPVNPGGRGMAN